MSQKRKKQVRCTLCTPFRWLGNAKDRFKSKDFNKIKEMKKEIDELKKTK